MVLQYPIRLPATALSSADPIQLRPVAERVDASRRVPADPSPSLTDAAAVVTFGERALGLARSTLSLPAQALATDPSDPNEIANARLRGIEPGDTEPALASLVRPNVSNPAILSALGADGQAARLRTQGTLDQESGLFEALATPRESGFFATANAAGDASSLRPLADGTLESTFPRAPAQSSILESGFFRSPSAATESLLARPLVNDQLESVFPQAQNDIFESGFPAARARTGALLDEALDNEAFSRNERFENRAPARNDTLNDDVFEDGALARNGALGLALPRALARNGALEAPALDAQSPFTRAPVNATEEGTRATIANAQTLFTGAPFVRNATTLFPRAVSNALAPAAAVVALRAARGSGPGTPDPGFAGAPVAGAEAASFRDPLASTPVSTFARAPAANPETALLRPPVANNAEAGLFRAPTGDGVEPSRAGDIGGNRAAAGERAAAGPEQLSAQQRRELQSLERNDRQVRANELAQRAAAGGHADGVRVRYRLGPDGRRYAVDSQVSFDVTPVPGDPAATLRKMEVVSRAANAATDPSATDRSAAAEAAQLMRQARAQLAAERYNEESDRLGRE